MDKNRDPPPGTLLFDAADPLCALQCQGGAGGRGAAADHAEADACGAQEEVSWLYRCVMSAAVGCSLRWRTVGKRRGSSAARWQRPNPPPIRLWPGLRAYLAERLRYSCHLILVFRFSVNAPHRQ